MGSEGRPPTKQYQSEELLLGPRPTKAGAWTERGAAAWWVLDEERHRSTLEAEERNALQMNLSEALSKALDEAQQRGVRVLWHGSVQSESPQSSSQEQKSKELTRATGLKPSTAPETGPRSTPDRAGPNVRASWLDGWFNPWSDDAAKVTAKVAAKVASGGEGRSTAEERGGGGGGGLLRHLSDISIDSRASSEISPEISSEISPETSSAARAAARGDPPRSEGLGSRVISRVNISRSSEGLGSKNEALTKCTTVTQRGLTGHRSDTSPSIRRRAKSRTRLKSRLFPNDAVATAGLTSPGMRSVPLALPAAAAVPAAQLAAQASSSSSTTSTIKTSNDKRDTGMKVSGGGDGRGGGRGMGRHDVKHDVVSGGTDAKAAALTAARAAEMAKFYATVATTAAMPKPPPSPADDTNLQTLEEVIEQFAFIELHKLAGECA